MKNIYVYSAQNNAFYFKGGKETFGKEWPDDVLDVDESLFLTFAGIAPEGKQRAAGEEGLPVWEDIPAPSRADVIASAEAERSQRLSFAMAEISLWQTELKLGIISDADEAKLVEWVTYIKALQSMNTDNAPDIHWPPRPA